MSKATRCFIINKLGELVISLLIVTILSFLLVRLSPIDPAEAYARRSMAAFSFTDEQMEALREKMGLNDSLPVQYVKWVRDAFHLDFGKSFVSGQSVFEKVTTAIGITVTIVIISAIIQAIFILLIGCLCYLTRKRIIGRALIFLCIAGVSIPSFFFASTYIDIFAVKLGVTSVVGNTGFVRYFPAAVCIAIGCIALFSPMLANNIKKEMEQDSAFYARCRGLSEGKILFRYALPSAVVTLLPNFCQMLGLCMAGSAIVERVFSLPGLGYLIIDSVLYRDSPVIHATNIRGKYLSSSAEYPFGTDDFGRCEFSRILEGGKITLGIVLVGSAIVILLGIFFGILLAKTGRRRNILAESILNAVTAIPPVAYLIIFIGIWGNSIPTMLVALTASLVLRMIKLVKTLIEGEYDKAYIMCAIACGASKMRIMLVHILPNIIRDVVQFICLSCAEMIIAISGFSFIGLSLGDDVIDWGVMLSDARALAGTHPQLLFYPIFFIFISSLCFNYLGRLLEKEGA